jgi:oligoribonuclease
MRMKPSSGNLVWLDLEMTGLDTVRDSIIEIATVVTDAHLNVLAEGPVIAIYQPEEILAEMDNWNQRQHKKTGLLDRVRVSTMDVATAEAITLNFLKVYANEKKSPLCGNSICQDRRFLSRCMPTLEQFFHYRNLDVSTLKELAKRWNPEVFKGIVKGNKHQALADILDSIEELRYYRESFLRVCI